MHGVLFFTVQRYDITIAVFECFGNFLKNFYVVVMIVIIVNCH